MVRYATPMTETQSEMEAQIVATGEMEITRAEDTEVSK